MEGLLVKGEVNHRKKVEVIVFFLHSIEPEFQIILFLFLAAPVAFAEPNLLTEIYVLDICF